MFDKHCMCVCSLSFVVPGCPIVLTGKFTGTFPDQLNATGTDSTGKVLNILMSVRLS